MLITGPLDLLGPAAGCLPASKFHRNAAAASQKQTMPHCAGALQPIYK